MVPIFLVLEMLTPNDIFGQNSSLSTANTTTYENEEHGFAFDYPTTWHNQYDAYEAQLNNVDIALADAFSNDTEGFEQTSFHVNVTDVRRSLGGDLQIRFDTPEDYIKNRINQENESLYQTSAGIKDATDYEESDEPLFTLDNLRNTTILVGGENASKVQYVISFEGEQKQFSMYIYLVKDDKVYELSFHSEPLNVPETLPIAENIIKSFRFL